MLYYTRHDWVYIHATIHTHAHAHTYIHTIHTILHTCFSSFLYLLFRFQTRFFAHMYTRTTRDEHTNTCKYTADATGDMSSCTSFITQNGSERRGTLSKARFTSQFSESTPRMTLKNVIETTTRFAQLVLVPHLFCLFHALVLWHVEDMA